MKEHFTKLREIMDRYEEQSEKQLSDLLKKQDERLGAIQDQIVNQMDKLYNDDLNLSSLE